MHKIKISLFLLLLFFFSKQLCFAQKNSDYIFLRGNAVSNGHFTGDVWLNTLLSADTTYNLAIGNVHFEPGERTFWHIHTRGQILLVTEGKGWYQEKGKQIQVIEKGDIIKCAANIPHWHGGTSETGMTHIAIGPNVQKNSVIWLNEVSDKEYKSSL